jgi:hypothetical protein
MTFGKKRRWEIRKDFDGPSAILGKLVQHCLCTEAPKFLFGSETTEKRVPGEWERLGS